MLTGPGGDQSPFLPLLKVQGNHIVDAKGTTVILKGLNICYPSILRSEGHWTEGYFSRAASWGARLIRVPIDPGSYRQYGKDTILVMLDQAVKWSKSNGMYTIIDWHSIGNMVEGIYQDPWEEEMKTNTAEMKDFWGAVAERYKGEPAVAFYEIFNEPSEMAYKGGALTWTQWRDINDSIIDVIYAHNPQAIPLVSGLQWAYDLSGVAAAPLRNRGIGFAVHPYFSRAPSEPWEQYWDINFGYLAKDYPVVLTEFGFDPHDTIYPPVYKTDSTYGIRVLSYAKNKGMPWAAFVFYNGPGWPMPLFKDWENYTPTESGAFFKGKLTDTAW
jgi:hypothetical protein